MAFAEVPVTLALLLPFTGPWMGGPQIAGAAALAIQRANADKTLLPVLRFRLADSGCSTKQGLAAMGELLEKGGRIDAVIGPGCSSACEATSYLTSAVGQGIPQISYACTSPTLSDKAEYGLVRAADSVPGS